MTELGLGILVFGTVAIIAIIALVIIGLSNSPQKQEEIKESRNKQELKYIIKVVSLVLKLIAILISNN